MFQINSIDTARGRLRFSEGINFSGGKLSLLTGPNGSGKTEVLTMLASYFQRQQKYSHDSNIDWSRYNSSGLLKNTQDNDGPERVIAQTFSPFSRFPRPLSGPRSVTDTYSDGRKDTAKYRAVGVYRGYQYPIGLLSRRAVEQGLLRMTESLNQAFAMGSVLRGLGFKEEIKLAYTDGYDLTGLVQAYRSKNLNQYFARRANALARNITNRQLDDELNRADPAHLSELVYTALDVIYNSDSQRFSIVFSFKDGRRAEDYAVLQALALLRRLGFLHLRECRLELIDVGTSLDIVHASSGQQQLLASIFGLMGELQENSLVLLDEPELSLHPAWQISFLERLEALMLPFPGCHVIIATHSPFIVQSAVSSNLEVVEMGAPNPGISLKSRRKQHRISVEEALVDVLHAPLPDSIYLADEIFEVVSMGEGGNNLQRQQALFRLRALRELYLDDMASKASINSLALIDQAIKLVLEPD